MRRRIIIAAFALLGIASSAGAAELRYPAARWIADIDRLPQAQPQVRGTYDPLDGFLRSTEEEVESISAAAAGFTRTPMQHLPGAKVEAVDTNNFDEAADSTWFVNRIGRYGPQPKAISAAMKECGPNPTGKLIVRGATVGDDLPVLLVEDRDVRRFAIHPDPADQPGAISARAVVSSLILSAAGYPISPHCPVVVDRNRLAFADGATYLGEYGKRRPLTPERLAQLLEKQPMRMTMVAMALPAGQPLDHWNFSGRRYGDKNDRIRHQERRALRGLRLISAFIGWADIDERAALDAFVETAPGKGHFEHLFFNLTEIREPPPKMNPQGAGASRINSAFAMTTPRDAFWATRIVARFSDDLLKAIVMASGFPSPAEQRQALADLMSRRDAITSYWFTRMSSLDDFVFTSVAEQASISCTDLAVAFGGADPSSRIYRAKLTTPFGRADIVPWQESTTCSFSVDREAVAALVPKRIYELRLQAKGSDDKWWLPEVKLYLRRGPEGAVLLGLERRSP